MARGKSALASSRTPSVTGPARRVSVVSSTEEEEEGAGAKGTKCAKGEGDAVRRYLAGICAGGIFALEL